MRIIVAASLLFLSMGCRKNPVEACRAAVERLALPPNTAAFVEACADMYEPPCRDAIVATGRSATPGTHADAVLAACHDTYCPRLPAPKPAACAGPVPDSRQDEAMAELDAAILAHLYGLRGSVLFSTTKPSSQGVKVNLPRGTQREVRERAAVMRVAPTPSGVTISVGAVNVNAGVDPAETEFAPILSALPPPGDAMLVVECEPGIAEETVTSITRKLGRAGYTRFAFSNRRSSGR